MSFIPLALDLVKQRPPGLDELLLKELNNKMPLIQVLTESDFGVPIEIINNKDWVEI